jgi:hypothetical protein
MEWVLPTDVLVTVEQGLILLVRAPTEGFTIQKN